MPTLQNQNLKLDALRLAEREVEAAERPSRDSGFDIAPKDREKICSQLEALKAAWARALHAWREASEEETGKSSRS